VNEIPLFGVDVGNGGKSDLGGFVLRPEAFKGDGGLLCAYPYDPHTFNYRCIPPGLSDTCVPGCCCGGSEGAPAWTQGVVGKNAYFQDACMRHRVVEPCRPACPLSAACGSLMRQIAQMIWVACSTTMQLVQVLVAGTTR